jgi:hypothetical protein
MRRLAGLRVRVRDRVRVRAGRLTLVVRVIGAQG